MSLSYKYPKEYRLRTRRDYIIVYQKGVRRQGSFLVVELFFDDNIQTKLGISVSRKYGKAVQRNRFKRLVRESFRLSKDKLPPNVMINVKPRQHALYANINDIQQELVKLINE